MPENHSQIRRPKYEDRVVALVDVLGLKDMLSEKHDEPPELAWKALERMQLEVSSQRDAENSGHQIRATGPITWHRSLDDGYTNLVESSGHPNRHDFQLSQFSGVPKGYLAATQEGPVTFRSDSGPVLDGQAGDVATQ